MQENTNNKTIKWYQRWLRLLERLISRRRIDILREIKSVHINETLDTRHAVIHLTFNDGERYSLWTYGTIRQRERYISIQQPIGAPTPVFENGWPKEITSELEANVGTVTPY